jgi:hypothetical protein
VRASRSLVACTAALLAVTGRAFGQEAASTVPVGASVDSTVARGSADSTVAGGLADVRAARRTDEADSTDRRALAASPLLPPDHWAVAAAWRAEAMGLVPLFMPAQRAVPRLLVARALEQAAGNAAGRDPRTRAMAEGWLARFREEFPEADPSRESTSPVKLLGGSAGGGYVRWTGRVKPGAGLYGGRTTVTPLDGVTEGEGRGVLAASAGRSLAVLAEPYARGGGAGLGRWDVRATLRAFALSVGREHLGWGPERGGAVVLNDAVLPRVELSTAEPVLPWRPLRFLGPVTLHAFATRLEEPEQPGRPYFWGMRATLRPHPRFTIGLNRAAMFGGDSIQTPTTAGNIARMLIGRLSKDFENQEVSADFRFRAPTEAVLPLLLYMEWGAEDEAGGWWHSPGRVVGAYAPSLPFAPQVGLGLEHTDFGVPPKQNPPWYLHLRFPGGWEYGDAPLGHPLGGEGREWMGYATADLLRARLRLEAHGFHRYRSAIGFRTRPDRSGNLYAPERAGVSRGGSVDASFRAARRAELRLSGYREAGSGWREQRLRLGAALLF